MYEVLVPVDTDENRALHQAKHVARLSGTATEVDVTVLYVTPPDEFKKADTLEFSEVDAAVEAAEYLEEQNISVNRVIDNGTVSSRIMHMTEERGIDEIVMGGRKRSGVAKMLLGSTVQDVALSAEVPVTITGDGMVFGDSIQNLLVPVDTDTDRALKQAEYATKLASNPEEIDITVLYVFPHQDYKGAPEHEFADVDAAVEAAVHLEAEGFDVERVATGGEVAETILEHADDADADSIVMGGRKRSGVQKVLLGSTTQDIFLSADRPVTITG